MHPILFRIPAFALGHFFFPGFDVYTYGVALSIAFAIAFWIILVRAKKAGISPETMSDLCFLILFAGIVGSRLLFILEPVYHRHYSYIKHFWEIFNLRQGGLSISGGLILGFLAGVWFVRKKKLNFWKVGDVIAPALAVGMGLGRIGCFFNGCCVGVRSHLPIAFVFIGNPTYHGHRLPTQLFELVLDLIAAAILFTRFKNTKPGTTFLWGAILVSIARFIVEFWRADRLQEGPLTLVQWICLATILAAVGFLVYLRRSSAESLTDTKNTFVPENAK